MKKLVLILLIMGFVIPVSAQKIIRLDELKMSYSKETLQFDSNSNTLNLNIPESYIGEFMKNPLGFVKKNFDINEVIVANSSLNYETYDVTFNSTKGYLNAQYDKIGDLKKSNFEFKNVRLPYQTSVDLFQKNQGWSIVKTKHIGYSKEWNVNKEYYKVKMAKGNKTKNLKINVGPDKIKERLASVQ